jgi:hypothetical protein
MGKMRRQTFYSAIGRDIGGYAPKFEREYRRRGSPVKLRVGHSPPNLGIPLAACSRFFFCPDLQLRNGVESQRDSGFQPRVHEPWVLMVSSRYGNLNEVLDSPGFLAGGIRKPYRLATVCGPDSRGSGEPRVEIRNAVGVCRGVGVTGSRVADSALSILCGFSAGAAEKLNIVLVMADDQGWSDTAY